MALDLLYLVFVEFSYYTAIVLNWNWILFVVLYPETFIVVNTKKKFP